MEKLDKYKLTFSKDRNYTIIDTIGVPHPYCLTPKHIAYASAYNGGVLTTNAIRESEEHGARCDICKGKLPYDKHEQALVVSCKKEIKLANDELWEYLLSLKEQVEKDGFAGFVFKQDF